MKNFKVTNKRENARVECIFYTRISSILKKDLKPDHPLCRYNIRFPWTHCFIDTGTHTYMNIAEMGNCFSECSFEIRVGNCPFRVCAREWVSVCVCWGFSEFQCLILICTLLLLCLLSDLHISSVFVYILFCHQFLPP